MSEKSVCVLTAAMQWDRSAGNDRLAFWLILVSFGARKDAKSRAEWADVSNMVIVKLFAQNSLNCCAVKTNVEKKEERPSMSIPSSSFRRARKSFLNTLKVTSPKTRSRSSIDRSNYCNCVNLDRNSKGFRSMEGVTEIYT